MAMKAVVRFKVSGKLRERNSSPRIRDIVEAKLGHYLEVGVEKIPE